MSKLSKNINRTIWQCIKYMHNINRNVSYQCFSVFKGLSLSESFIVSLCCQETLSPVLEQCCASGIYTGKSCTVLLFHHRCPGSLVRWIGVRPPTQNSSHLHNSPTLIFLQLAEWGWMAAGGVLMRRWRRWTMIWWERTLFGQRQPGLWPSCGRASCAVWGQAVMFAAAST